LGRVMVLSSLWSNRDRFLGNPKTLTFIDRLPPFLTVLQRCCFFVERWLSEYVEMFVSDLIEVVTMSPPSLSSCHRLVLKLDYVFLEDEAHAQKCLQNSKRDRNVVASLSCVSNQYSTVSVVFQNSV